MRTLNAAVAAACILGSAHAAPATYKLAPQNRAAKYGQYIPTALTDYGLAAGTINYYTGGSDAYFSHGKFFSDDAFCAQLGSQGGTSLTGISRDSQLTYTVGACYNTAFSYIYNQSANTTSQIAYPGAVSTLATGVNTNGFVSGVWEDGTAQHGFTLLGGTFTSFDPPGSTVTYAQGVTGTNGVYGTYSGATSVYTGFLLNGTTYTTLSYPGAAGTIVTGENDTGLVTGYYYDSADTVHAFAWQNGTFSQPPLTGGVQSVATGVNNSGEIAGYSANSDSVTAAFIWQPSTNKLITVAAPAGTTNIVVEAINDTNAQFTGTYTKGSKTIAYIATCKGKGCF